MSTTTHVDDDASLHCYSKCSSAYVSQSLCYKKSAGLMPLLIVNPTCLSVISVFTGIKSLSALEVRWSGQGQSRARPKALWNGILIVKMKNVLNFFSGTSEFSEECLRKHHLDLDCF